MGDPIRCGWCLSSDLYKEYHDQEWGTPVYDDATLSELLILETFQAKLSLITILNKRERFSKAFDNFDYKKIARYSEDKIQALLLDAGIIRDKSKSLKVNYLATLKITLW
jgi:DNA-3-methyladenine glycosylase I